MSWASRFTRKSARPTVDIREAVDELLDRNGRTRGFAVFEFTETRDKGKKNPGYILHFSRHDEGEDEPKLSAEIDIRSDRLRGTIVGVNQGRERSGVTRLTDPWQLVYHNLTSGITDAQRFLLELEEAPAP